MLRKTCLFLALLALCTTLTASDKALRIYFIDVEGGQATLFVTPAGQSLLIDTGWPGNDGRDANRIVTIAKEEGINKLDYVLLTHYHEDHAGGIAQLAAKIPIGTFIDHGENRETSDPSPVKWYAAYQEELARGHEKRLVVKPGDKLPIKGIEAIVVSADGNVIANALPGAGSDNKAACAATKQPQPDQTENVRSLGTVFTFGKLRILDLGDLTKDKEMELMCPMNKLGIIDIYIVSHHGWDHSGSPALVDGIHPRVAIMDNGAKKGGSPSSWEVIEKSPGLEDLWQLHYSEEGGVAHNVKAAMIANPSGPDQAHYLKLTAWPDSHFTVFNSRTTQEKKYAPR